MKIAVCVKHVPEGSLKLDPGSKRLDRSGEGAGKEKNCCLMDPHFLLPSRSPRAEATMLPRRRHAVRLARPRVRRNA